MPRIAVALILVALAAPALADPVAPQAPTAAMRAYRDPQTGQWVAQPATPEQLAAAQVGLGHRNDALMRAETVPGVGVLLHLNGQVQMSTVVHRDADGHFATSCVTSAAAPADSQAPAQ